MQELGSTLKKRTFAATALANFDLDNDGRVSLADFCPFVSGYSNGAPRSDRTTSNPVPTSGSARTSCWFARRRVRRRGQRAVEQLPRRELWQRRAVHRGAAEHHGGQRVVTAGNATVRGVARRSAMARSAGGDKEQGGVRCSGRQWSSVMKCNVGKPDVR